MTLTATPASGFTFSGWTGDCSGTGTCTLTMDVNKTVGATFTVTQHTLTVTVGANGSVSSSPAGISSCTNTGGTCSASFDHGTEVTLTAVGSSGYATGSWTGYDSASGDICVVTMTADRAVSAAFQPVVASDDFNRPVNWSLGGNWLESERNGDTLQVNSTGVYMVPYWCCPAAVVPSAGLAMWANLDTVEPQFSQLRRTDRGRRPGLDERRGRAPERHLERGDRVRSDVRARVPALGSPAPAFRHQPRDRQRPDRQYRRDHHRIPGLPEPTVIGDGSV